VRGLAVRRSDAGEQTVVAIRLGTGRPHQIRIHLAAIGHPLVGDPLYGPGGVPVAGARTLPGGGGYRLHATAVAFPHPATGERVVVECAPPPGLRLPAFR
jgi:23S rRNA pseudouridine1911/1915/1917 synthase